MGYQPLEGLLPQAGGSRYKLVMLAARRAVELAEGMPKFIAADITDKPTTIALNEILARKVIIGGVGVEIATEEVSAPEAPDAEEETQEKDEKKTVKKKAKKAKK